MRYIITLILTNIIHLQIMFPFLFIDYFGRLKLLASIIHFDLTEYLIFYPLNFIRLCQYFQIIIFIRQVLFIIYLVKVQPPFIFQHIIPLANIFPTDFIQMAFIIFHFCLCFLVLYYSLVDISIFILIKFSRFLLFIQQQEQLPMVIQARTEFSLFLQSQSCFFKMSMLKKLELLPQSQGHMDFITNQCSKWFFKLITVKQFIKQQLEFWWVVFRWQLLKQRTKFNQESLFLAL